MKKIIFCLLAILITIYSCSSDNDLEIAKVNLSFNFSHNWNNSTTITNADFNEIKFKNQNGDSLSISRLRYLVSEVTLINRNGDTILSNDYNLVEVTNNENLTFTLSEKIPVGTYNTVKFRFGFASEKNVDGVYQDLNTASFNVGQDLGGGYHFMQFEGNFINSTEESQGFSYHTISAIDKSDPNNIVNTDTSFEVNLGEFVIGDDTTIEVAADLSEWFKNPNIWNLNELNSMLMGNYNAQLQMSANGKSVFRLAN